MVSLWVPLVETFKITLNPMLQMVAFGECGDKTVCCAVFVVGLVGGSPKALQTYLGEGFMENGKKILILASASPRRQSYLKDLGLSFQIVVAEIEEKRACGEMAEAYVRRLASEKAACVAKKYPKDWIIAADTVVVHGDTVLEKPESEAAAVAMLMRLSGGEHRVLTGLCLQNRGLGIEDICQVSTQVSFWNVGRKLIESYVQTGEPMDKAGSYGIQGKGAFLVQKICGSYSNVVGLPLAEFIEMLIRYQLLTNG